MSIFTVTNLSDSGEGSLRAAINLANEQTGADEITFELEGDKPTISLTGGELHITDSLTIDGSGINELTIDAGELSRVFNIDDGDNDNLIDVALTNMVVTGGQSSGNGGGIYNTENLQIADAVIDNNITEDGFGGGIYNDSDNLTIINSTVSGNIAKAYDYYFYTVYYSTGYGGGIFNIGDLTITNSTVSGNTAGYRGGGIESWGDLKVTNSTVSDNIAESKSGGGIESLGNLTITNSTVSDNTAYENRGGGIIGWGDLTVTNSTVSGNTAESKGGGIYNRGDLTVTSSTVSDNTAESSGGGIYNPSDLTITNSTVSGNTAEDGGGISNTGDLTITNSTVTNNESSRGAGVLNGNDSRSSSYPIGTAMITSSIIADNKNGKDIDIQGESSFTSGDNNLIGSADDVGFVDGVNGDLVGTPDSPLDPRLDVLQDNGGATLTHALKDDSPAIDAGSNPERLIVDQRGKRRVAGDGIDIGALEHNAEDIIPIEGNDEHNLLVSEPEASIVRGYGGDDEIFGDQGDDTLDGGAGNDTITGNNGYDTLNGNSGNDKLRGGNGNDFLDGNTGDDTLVGGRHFDRLDGGDGHDILIGNHGIDVLRGGAGQDLFYLENVEGRDWIIDFELDLDKIGLADGMTYDSLEITGNVNSFIAYQGHQVAVVLGVHPQNLTATSFLEF